MFLILVACNWKENMLNVHNDNPLPANNFKKEKSTSNNYYNYGWSFDSKSIFQFFFKNVRYFSRQFPANK